MRVPSKNFYRVARLTLVFLVLLTAFCAGLHTVGDSDMGWHLATGRWVVEHRQVPRTDVLSFTSVGTPWTYPPFAGVLLFLIYSSFGYVGLSWFCALACVAVVGYLVRRRDAASALLALLAIGSIATRIGARADLFTTVFFALVFGELWAYHCGLRIRPWLLPILMLLWVNLHPGFVAGVAAIAAYLLMEITDLLFRERREGARIRLRRIWPWLAASLAATLANPWGPKIYAATLGMLGAAGATAGKINANVAVAEFRGVPISTHMLYELIDVRHPQFGFVWLLVVAVVLVGLLFWNREIGGGLVVSCAVYAALTHVRYDAIFAIIVATVGPALFDKFAEDSAASLRGKTSDLRRSPSIGVIALLVFACAVSLLQIVDLATNRNYMVFDADLRFGAGPASWLPSRAAEFIVREQLPGNVFEDYELGGYAAWSLGPMYPDFIDGRGNNPDLGVEQFNLYSEDPDSPEWQNEADRWKLNVLLVATAGLRGLRNLDVYKFCQSTNWRPVYMDDVSLVFLRNTPSNSSWLNRLALDCSTKPISPPSSASRSVLHEFYVNSGELLSVLHRDRESEASLQHADESYPGDPTVHLLKGLLFEREHRNAEAEQEYRTSLAINENGGVWYSLGRLYGSEGRNSEALAALKRAAGLSLQPFDIYMTMGKLQLVLNQPEQALSSFASAEATSPYRGGGESLAPEVYAELAEGRSEAYRRMGNWNEAIAQQREAIQSTPRELRRWDRLARLYEASGRTNEAAEVRRRMSELQIPGNSDARSSQ